MNSFDFVVPEATKVRVVDQNNNELFTEELIVLDEILGLAQKDIPHDQLFHRRKEWLEALVDIIEERYGVSLSFSQAYLLSSMIATKMREFLGN